MKYPKIPLAQTVLALCKAKNIKHIVLSPGSRNAPLTIGFTHNPFFKCYSIVDERCAGFFCTRNSAAIARTCSRSLYVGQCFTELLSGSFRSLL